MHMQYKFLFKACVCVTNLPRNDSVTQCMRNAYVFHQLHARITKLRRNIADTDAVVVSMPRPTGHQRTQTFSRAPKRTHMRSHSHAHTCTHAHMHTHKYAQKKCSRRTRVYTHMHTQHTFTCSEYMLAQHCRELEQAFQNMWLSYLANDVGGRGGGV